VEGAAVVFVFAEVGMQEDMRLGIFVRIEKPVVSKGLSKFELESCTTGGKVVDEGLGREFAVDGKDNSSSAGKSVYRGAGHLGSARLDMVLIAARGFLRW
jgi:hypothetical protein